MTENRITMRKLLVLHLFAFDALMQRFFGHLIKSLMNLVKLNFGT